MDRPESRAERPRRAGLPTKAASGCWTCKRRKIGCDRALPACSNCQRTRRTCDGYGRKLTWPDRHDGRRKAASQVVTRTKGANGAEFPIAVVHGYRYGSQFVNVTTDDIASVLGQTGLSLPASILRRARAVQSLPPNLPCSRLPGMLDHVLQPPGVMAGGALLQYYEQRLSRMISTVDARNGFRTTLLPIALSHPSDAAAALLHAILAVSAVHAVGVQEALPYKTEALRLLGRSLTHEAHGAHETHDFQVVDVDAQLATSLMLCVYNVFDEHEGSWHLHLRGARSLVRQRQQWRGWRPWAGTHEHDDFLYTWFMYHDVLGTFSQRPGRGTHDSALPSDWIGVTRKPTDMTTIIGSMGCSTELMALVQQINALRGSHTLSSHASATLQGRLGRLEQRLSAADAAHHTEAQQTTIRATAELYRIAAMLYLHEASAARAEVQQVHPQHPLVVYKPSAGPPSALLDRAIVILGTLDVCTSPWPLFVVACAATTDAQRVVVRQTLDRMDEDRRIGNLVVLRAIIDAFWTQRDLQADQPGQSQALWWDVFAGGEEAPWFI